ncbi:hypothetical protein H6G54_08350 [Anabaena cylindrica FACHB-243]|uniref:Uncharacterized protein n=1 Tax=Anabaena cylindrica (strain ATCC 27899 / PCC 7122) TaxID=272123 RepID=K9ZM19_ANACC|nr:MULTISPECIES: hypothetical protein [Anabaena]AFZ60231.1 hypothetical protein Anacy_4888 [Anabaena cylindrica PCC 7122]MBD2417716.1 hypothetical protein [Anabaena cylindrica FACHB-243]MBY5281293.1 hypothetical protein [Anabaena sp. CCAP 1446/1C]MBY5306894.1 hypothetical protein [Anabaena sp. CCAP 1446/1C]MCM2404631.1 hypothetical protein [Anabaena sp. CCAP 1446/1C]
MCLQDAIKNLEDNDQLPLALPIAHLTSANWLNQIAEEKMTLKPQYCKVFEKDLLYFSYGGIFHRPSPGKPRELPIAFMFSPELLQHINYYYPYDTGAAASRKYGENWSSELINFPKYCLKGDFNTPRKLVRYIYGNNHQYLEGNIQQITNSLPSPLQTIRDFLSLDLTSEGIDHRQCSIECQTETVVPLTQYLLWVGWPQERLNEFKKLWRNSITEDRPIQLPKIQTYNFHSRFDPKGIAAILEDRAKEAIVEDYCQFDNT